MNYETIACCAHCKVELKHIDYPNGTRSDYWECAYGCGKKFVPVNIPREEMSLRVRNLLLVSDYMLARVVEEILKNPQTDLYYDIMAECQCRNEDGTFINYTPELPKAQRSQKQKQVRNWKFWKRNYHE